MNEIEKKLNELLMQSLLEEQAMYRSGLCAMPPEQILSFAREYVIREELLKVIREGAVSAEQANVLLQLRNPLSDLCACVLAEEREHARAIYLDTVKWRADQLIRMYQDKDGQER